MINIGAKFVHDMEDDPEGIAFIMRQEALDVVGNAFGLPEDAGHV
ncbi:MAG: hypothetical protein Q4P24_09390 [Rhodobacterales bacterium]|nr:hypothetical protein [Rhodobacterales bacterium]